MTKNFLARLSRIAIIATLLVVPFLTLSAQINLPDSKMSLQEIAKRISAQSSYKFFYNDDIASVMITVSNIENGTIEQTLDTVFENSEISYRIDKNVVYLSKSGKTATSSVQPVVKGKVTDINGIPLIGVSIKAGTEG